MPAGDAQTGQELYEFGPFRIDPEKQLLLRDGELISLAPKAFQLLLVLVRRGNQVVSKDELMKAVWPDTFVEETNLTRNIFILRKALGETDLDPFIVTVPGQGYRFATAVRPVADAEMCIAEVEHAKVRVQIEETSHWQWIVAIAVLLAVGAGAWSIFRSRPVVLGEKDTVVLADFVNSTDDPVFDGALRQGLSVQLEQSPFLSLISDRQMQQTLGQMGQPADAKLTPSIARELCQRTASAAVVDGTIAKIGTPYLLTLKAVSCVSGDTLASVQAQATDKNHILDALGKTASEMRRKLGESLSTVQKFDTPLERATTPSLEALKAYSLGRKAMAGSLWADAVPFFHRAIQLDPNFSMAYARLGTSYRMMGEPTLAADNTRKAYELREHVSELEKFYIESHYYQQTTGELEKARQVYELWAQSYPRDWSRPSGETAVTSMLGQFDEELAESREELRLTSNGDGYMDLLDAYLSLNRLEEAQSTVEEAKANGFDSPSLRALLYELRFLQNDAAGMSQQVVWAKGKPGVEDTFLHLEADTAAYSGKLGLARDLSRAATASAKRSEKLELAAGYQAEAAIREALFGYPSEAAERAADACELSNGWYAQSVAALALALAGDAVRSGTLADDLGNRFPTRTIVQSYYLPTIRAQQALSRKDPAKAIELLETASPYELSDTGYLYPVYVRGESYLAAHKGDKAAAEFQKILDHRGIVANAPIGSLAHLGLGRAYALSGDKAKAKSAYQDFLALWKDAEPDIPLLKQAKEEYARLD
jgi:DNA-binding winged helix-turn-helix (wHTH) protein